MDCIFCKIIKKEIPANIVYEDEKVIAFHDINPITPVHILVVPKEHIETLVEIKESENTLISHIYQVINKIAKQLKIDEKGFRVIVNCKEDGGQVVGHLHFHLLGGKKLGVKIA